MKYPKRSQYKHAKSQYRVSNWPEYEAGLQRRGDLTIWLSDTALDASCCAISSNRWASSYTWQTTVSKLSICLPH